MSELIEKQQAIDAMENWFSEMLTTHKEDYSIREILMELPPVEQCEEDYPDCRECKHYDHEKHHCPRFCAVIRDAIEPKQGKWIKMEVGYKCSNCSLCGNKHAIDFYRYCPNCGSYNGGILDG